jgi:hypothetical protein
VRKKSIMKSPPPTPPPRTSSAKQSTPGTGRSLNNSIDDTLSRTMPPRPSTAPSSSGKEAVSSVPSIPRDDRVDSYAAVITHESLQQSIKQAPPRPTRTGTSDLGESRPTVYNSHKAAFSHHQRQLLEGFEDVTPRRQVTPSHGAASDTEQSTDGDKVRRSPSRLGKFSKLRVFGSRNASSEVEKSPKKLQRRGPSAGTGHEGYGKYAKRGRKQSGETAGTRSDSDRSQSSTRRIPLFSHSRKTSTTSRRTSQSDLDEFAVPRLKPVIMRGGSQTSVATDNPSSEPAYLHSPEMGSSRGMTPSPAPVDQQGYNMTRVVSPLSQSSLRSLSPRTGEPSQSLAVRRSQRFGPTADSIRLPTPIRTDDLHARPTINSYDTSVSSTVPSSTAPSLPPSELYRIDPGLLKERKSRRRWWNPFKSQRQGIVVPKPVSISAPEPEMAVTIATGPAPRSIPYYAMIESESEENTAEHMVERYDEAVRRAPSPSPEHEQEANVPRRATESVLLPSAPIWTTEGSIAHRAALEGGSTRDASKQPRLAQVGRIPKVVNRSERRFKPSRQSFSQPFARAHPLEQPQYLAVEEQFSEGEPPLLQIHTDVLPSRPFQEAEDLSAKPFSAPAYTHPPQFEMHEPFSSDLVQIQTTHSSDMSTTSSSAGMLSIMGPAIVPAPLDLKKDVVPLVQSPLEHTGDEDVWNEFDDMIDHVMSPSRSPKKLSLQEHLQPQAQRGVVPVASASPLIDHPPIRPTSKGKMPAHEARRAVMDLSSSIRAIPPNAYPSPPLMSDRTLGEEIRLRRSRIVSALHSSYDPSSPFSMREFLKDYSEPRDSMTLSERYSSSTAARSTLIAAPLPEEQEPERSHQDNAIMLDVAERARNPAKQSELHFASLEVARWLSFGRVLFSPAQDEIFTLPERNVLVIDGLGNEDWSIYCAVTYEASRAMVYDLKEASYYKKPSSPQESERAPSNHRRVEVANVHERFPFQSSFFSVVVLRFPPAMSETKLKNIVAECRRILAPGGHIEVMLLDFDFVNMGVQTRRAVRDLKMRMATKKPDVSLKPTIDNFQSLLGGRGFTGLNRCVVGVPVVGRAPGSTDSSSSSRSSSGVTAGRLSDPTRATRASRRGQNFSLSDLVADPSESADAQIGRMVSKTARSWWQHCYEAAVIPNGDLSRSIFSEKKVMQECKMRASSFKLLIAFAQRPVFEARRRTMSEPAATLTSTAGARRTKVP